MVLRLEEGKNDKDPSLTQRPVKCLIHTVSSDLPDPLGSSHFYALYSWKHWVGTGGGKGKGKMLQVICTWHKFAPGLSDILMVLKVCLEAKYPDPNNHIKAI